MRKQNEKTIYDYWETLDKKFELLDATDDKLSFDFDIVNILKAIDNFEDFKVIYFDGPQYQLFNSLANKVVGDQIKPNLDDEEKEKEKGMNRQKTEALENVSKKYEDFKRKMTEAKNNEMNLVSEEERDQRVIQVIMDNLIHMSRKKYFTVSEKKLFQIMGIIVGDIRKYEKSLTFNPKLLDLDEDGIPDEEEKKLEELKNQQIYNLEKAMEKFRDNN